MKKTLFFAAVGALVIWSFVSYHALPLLIAIIAMVIWAFSSDKKMWRTKPTAELVALFEGDEWRYWQTALKELFPEFKEQLRGYLPTQDVAISRQKIAPVLAKYEI